MSWVAVAAGGAAIGSALIGSSSAKKAASAQEMAAQRALGTQTAAQIQGREDLAPWRGTGTQAAYKLAQLTGLGGSGMPKPTYEDAEEEALRRHIRMFGVGYQPSSDMAKAKAEADRIYAERLAEWQQAEAAAPTTGQPWDPMSDPITAASFQFGLEEGRKAINRGSPLRQGFDSGATLKALTRYGTDYTAQKGNEAFNRLFGISGMGQNAASQSANMAMLTGTGQAQTQASLGNALGASQIAQGNAWQAIPQAAGTIGSWWAQNQMLDRLLKQPQSSNYGIY
jgi:hypothetical protein